MSCGWRRRALKAGARPIAGTTPFLSARPLSRTVLPAGPWTLQPPGSTPNRWHPRFLLCRLAEWEAGAGGAVLWFWKPALLGVTR